MNKICVAVGGAYFAWGECVGLRNTVKLLIFYIKFLFENT